MRKNPSLLSFPLFIVILLLNGCAPAFPSVASFYVSPFDLTPDEKLLPTSLALSPDGEKMALSWAGGHDFINLRTGERIDLVERLGLPDLEYANRDIISGDRIFWSSDGHYLGMVTKHYENGDPAPTGRAFYRFDLRTNAAERYEINAYAFSPFDSNKVLTENGVYDLRDGTLLPFVPDFREEEKFGAIDYSIWSEKLGVPVAELGSLPHSGNDDVEIVLQPWYPAEPLHPKYSIPTGLTVRHPNQLSRILFAPMGEYILAIEWQCFKSPKTSQTLCSENPSFPKNVYDTVLIIIHWRTQEQQELIRLSEIDPEHVVADGYMAWSADGSTIFISRKDALPVVLKVKYP